jgi:hypothetical protein
MSEEQPKSGPVSAFLTPIDGLIRNRNLSAPKAPGQLATLERFEILRLIGVGGMGVVFLARDPTTDAKVAIKMLRPELAVEPQAVHRFLKEVRHLRRLQHPHILGILEMSERKEGPYFVMPYLERGSLARIIRPGEPLASELTLRIACQIAEALAFAHSKGIIHRDLKPGNILLETGGTAFLTDFGLARTLFNDSMMDVDRGHCEGTAPYMSPAVAAGQAEDTRCDIYSFGAVLYEMLTGQAPYAGETTAEVLKKIQAGQPKRISELSPKASSELAGIAEGAMARSHRDRYASMADVVADLERVGRKHSPLGPHGQWKTPGRWPSLIRRRPMAGVAAVILAAVTWLGVLWLQPTLKVVRQFQLPEDSAWAYAHFGDWDGDGELDLFLPRKKKCLVFSTDGSQVIEFGPREEMETDVGIGLVADMNSKRLGLTQQESNRLDDIFLHWAGGGKAHTAAYNHNTVEILRLSIDDTAAVHPTHGTLTHTALVTRRIVDLNHDGIPEILALAATDWGKAPRGVYCFGGTNQALRWEFQIAPSVTEFALTDLDGDGADDLLIGSHAVSNTHRLSDGTDDDHCYLYAVSSKGALLWRKELGDTFVACFPVLAQPQPGQQRRLYALVQRNYEDPGLKVLGRVVEFDAQGHQIRVYDAGTRLVSCLAEDFDDDGRPDILATDRLGFLHVLDLDLRLVNKLQITPNAFSSVELNLIAVTNLTGRSKRQLVFSSSQVEFLGGHNPGHDRFEVTVRFFHNNCLQVWDSSLRPVATYTFEKKLKREPTRTFRVADWDGDGIQEIVVLDKQVRVLKYSRRRF